MPDPTLRLILGDQLATDISSLADLDPDRDVVLMAEVVGEATYVRHHKKKIAFVFAAMRHFADDLRARGITVDYVTLDADGNSGSLRGEAARAVERHGAARIVVTEPGEYRLRADMDDWAEAIGVPVEVRDDDRFFVSRSGFANWAEGRKELRMEDFYRAMRRRTGLLMDDGAPAGGAWNFDKENREPLKRDRYDLPQPLRFEPDATTRAVLDLVADRFYHHFGDLEPFWFAVTAEQAEAALDHFIAHALADFGAYQDAMLCDEPFLYHSCLSPYLNAGLLSPRAVCDRVEAAYREGHIPINSAEGFIRQILGWREYVRGLYWLDMPDYAESNALGASRPLPAFYWTGETDMACLAQAIGATKREAYAHHIQRLMVTGNFALIAGLAPANVEEWYLVVYADAYEWVELPNTHGMALFADGGRLGSKPYASGGNYINRMSDYCAGCRYDVKAKSGADACPFGYLYWDFLMRNRAVLGGNRRLAMPYRTLDRMDDTRHAEIRSDAKRFLDSLA